MLDYKRADSKDLNQLNKIAYESEAYWGYDETFMGIFKEKYTIEEEFLRQSETFVMTDDEGIIGFFSLKKHGIEATLEYFYIRVDQIGRGMGRKMWELMLEVCLMLDVESLSWVTSPGAIPFYTKMGSSRVGEVSSTIDPSLKIPAFKFQLK